MKTMEQFFTEVKENKALQQAFQAAVTSGTAEAFLKEQQVDATLAELEAYGKSKNGELSDDELEAVAGGELDFGSEGYADTPEEVVFEFNIGDRVEVYAAWIFYFFTNRATVIDRKVEPEGYAYRPKYLVQFDGDGEPVQRWKNQDDLSY